MSGTNASPPCFDGLEKDQYYSILHNMLQYYTILQETYIEILQSKMESSSSRVVIFQHGQAVLIGRNYHFVPGPKEPFTIPLGFGVIIIKSTILCQWVRGLRHCLCLSSRTICHLHFHWQVACMDTPEMSCIAVHIKIIGIT